MFEKRSEGREPNVSAHILIAVVPVEHKTESTSQPRSECEHFYSDRGLALDQTICQTQTEAHTQTFSGLIPKQDRDPNVGAYIRMDVMLVEEKVKFRSHPPSECAHSHSDRGLVWDVFCSVWGIFGGCLGGCMEVFRSCLGCVWGVCGGMFGGTFETL